MFPLLIVLIFPTLAVGIVYPVLYEADFSAAPSHYNPNVTFDIKCTVGIKPVDVDYSVIFFQNGKSIGEYDMNG